MASPTIERPARRLSPSRVLITLAIVAMVAMWGYVAYLAFGPGRQDPPDRLDDPAFAVAAQARCRTALGEVAALPRANQARDADERADVITQANAIFEAMLDDLTAISPPGEDGRLVEEWLSDWRTYLGDRQEYATTLRQDPEADLFVTAKANRQITQYLDAFASDNKMISCGTPIDV